MIGLVKDSNELTVYDYTENPDDPGTPEDNCSLSIELPFAVEHFTPFIKHDGELFYSAQRDGIHLQDRNFDTSNGVTSQTIASQLQALLREEVGSNSIIKRVKAN